MFERIIQYPHEALSIDKEMEIELINKREEARQKYWDACKYPRKKKKQMRKRAELDYVYYSFLLNPNQI